MNWYFKHRLHGGSIPSFLHDSTADDPLHHHPRKSYEKTKWITLSIWCYLRLSRPTLRIPGHRCRAVFGMFLPCQGFLRELLRGNPTASHASTCVCRRYFESVYHRSRSTCRSRREYPKSSCILREGSKALWGFSETLKFSVKPVTHSFYILEQRYYRWLGQQNIA